MNLKSYDKSTRMIKLANLAATGMGHTTENNVLMVGIIDCAQNNTQAIKENLAFGIRKENGIALNYQMQNYDFIQRVTPTTAKYARNYIDTVAKNTAALVRTQMLDCVVAIVDNCVMGLGVLTGCTVTNCPVILMPVGINNHYDQSVLQAAGKMAIRELKSTDVEKVANTYVPANGTPANDSLTMSFLRMAEAFNLTLPGATGLQAGHGDTLQFALMTGCEAIKRADDIITTKRLISKRTINDNLAQYQNNGGDAAGLLLFKNIMEMVDLKMPLNLFPTIKGTIADQAFAAAQYTAPLTMEGQAWVYHNIADALTALTSNAIDNGVIVLQNCVGCDVSLVALNIVTMNKVNDIALITDGYCIATPVLTVANITPNGFDNQDFANIQNGDMIEIDITKGRVNTNVNSKDMKLRAKRNITKKDENYF